MSCNVHLKFVRWQNVLYLLNRGRIRARFCARMLPPVPQAWPAPIRAQFRSEFDLYSIAVFSWSNVLARHSPVEYSAIRPAIFARMLSVIGRKCPWRASARQDPLSALRRLKTSKKNNSRPSCSNGCEKTPQTSPKKEFASVFLETGNEITTKRGESFVP